MALQNLGRAQEQMKAQQKNAGTLAFKAGDKVLILLPTPGAPLKNKNDGPYIVSRNV